MTNNAEREGFNKAYGEIIKALADIVANAPQTDEQCEAELIPRPYVMDRVVRIREAMDALSKLWLARAQASDAVSEPVAWNCEVGHEEPVGNCPYCAANTPLKTLNGFASRAALPHDDGKVARDALVEWLRNNGKRYTEQRGGAGRYPNGEGWGHAYGVEVVKFDAKDFDAAIRGQRR